LFSEWAGTDEGHDLASVAVLLAQFFSGPVCKFGDVLLQLDQPCDRVAEAPSARDLLFGRGSSSNSMQSTPFSSRTVFSRRPHTSPHFDGLQKLGQFFGRARACVADLRVISRVAAGNVLSAYDHGVGEFCEVLVPRPI
jgi:hypothetical protein